MYVIPACGNEQMCLPVSQEKDNAFPLLGTGASWCAKISMLLLCSFSDHPIFFSGEMLLVNFSLFIELASSGFTLVFWILCKRQALLKCFSKDYLIQWNDAVACTDCGRTRKGTEIVYYSHKSCSKMSKCRCVR